MDAFELLLNRSSFGKLEAPAPSKEQMELVYRAALRAPDHAGLRPWKFLVYQDEHALKKLGESFLEAKLKQNPELPEAKQQKALNMPFRAPMIIIAVTEYQEHKKVPEVEQVVSCGCAVHGMLYALQALGFSGYWRTGDLAFNPYLKQSLGIKPSDEIAGFLYIGTPKVRINKPDQANPEDYFFVQ
ncbi:nitroreductase family protein [Pleionea mediterranea]|uniref:Putative NAD(P)H nitroreductase n=1 Tax=Pleionea mediterranea TaxID=523701 RepID=A0A316FM28_9GAMM|nr:nitroreductase family protein [Pleionea mediterranea]PWK49938.1 nitroreductase [Pleionea mediterranea]